MASAFTLALAAAEPVEEHEARDLATYDFADMMALIASGETLPC